MASAAPKTRNWRAIENAHEPEGLHIIVSGEVEVNSTGKEPHLSESPERNPKNLGLHLTILEGAGPKVKIWKVAHFHKVVKANEYDNVFVRWNISRIAEFPVHDDGERHAYAKEAMATLNATAKKRKGAKRAGKKPAKKAAKKSAAKKAPKKSKKKR
jgi:hypothetical protein